MDTKMMDAVISATLNNAIDSYKKQSVEKAVEEGCEERITGNGWNDWSEYICTSCKAVMDGRFIKSKPNYCPNCGKAFNKK